ncbi:probable phospholipase A2 homolog 2 [Oryza brachyantha]|uniref:probable phospholipase A2 homolog 2 n=1 Tax=Oryza brachyantha TaxID=4533 RepID=UPI0003EA7EE1|nr:probable phospholipase A2 homolog 2 [Oryza brachyantha]
MEHAQLRRLLLVVVLIAAATERSLAGLFGSPPPGSAAAGHDEDNTCSRACESQHCAGTYAQAPLMRYGKYCGVSYTGCPGEAPCDALDACCMLHDACVQATDNDYLNMLCNQSLLDCVAAVRSPAARGGGGGAIRTFEGNQCNMTDVADEITSLVKAAVFAKRILHKP